MRTYVIVNSEGKFFSGNLNQGRIRFSWEYSSARVYSTGSYWPKETAQILHAKHGVDCRVICDYGLDTETVLS